MKVKKQFNRLLFIFVSFLLLFAGAVINISLTDNNSSAVFAYSMIVPEDVNLINAIQNNVGENYDDPLIMNEYEELIFEGKNIFSLENLNYYSFNNLKRIKFYNNKISKITTDMFSTMRNLEEITLSNNIIDEIKLDNDLILDATYKLNLKSLNLKNNKITSATIKCMAPNSIVNLNNNNIKNINDVIFDDTVNPTIYLLNNMITEVEGLIPSNMELGIQNVRDGDKLIKSSEVYFYPSTNLPDLIIKFNGTSVIDTVKEMNYGKYTVTYESSLLQSVDSPFRSFFNSFTFEVVPEAPIIKYYEGDNEVPFAHIYKTNIKVVFENPNNEGILLFQIGSDKWYEGNFVNIRDAGNFSILCKVVVNGVETGFEKIGEIESSIKSTVFCIQKISPFWLVFIIILTILTLFFGAVLFVTLTKRSNAKRMR